MTKRYRRTADAKAQPAKMKAAGPSEHDLKARREQKRRNARKSRAQVRKYGFRLR